MSGWKELGWALRKKYSDHEHGRGVVCVCVCAAPGGRVVSG